MKKTKQEMLVELGDLIDNLYKCGSWAQDHGRKEESHEYFSNLAGVRMALSILGYGYEYRLDKETLEYRTFIVKA